MIPPWLTVIGGSLGSTAALKRILPALPPVLPAAILIATHMSGTAESHLAHVLSATSAWPVEPASDKQIIKAGHVYVAVPGRHLLVHERSVLLGTGPRENMARPAVDPLFRSAALAGGPRVIGVVLSGMLDDAVAGLHAIRQCGGVAVVQHPMDAEAGTMPLAAMAVGADHVAAADEIAPLLARLIATGPAAARPIPPDLELEVQVAAGRRLGAAGLRSLGSPAPLTCPHCSGVLSRASTERPLRFRCLVGEDRIPDIATILRNRTGHDFHGYKSNTFLRRIQRRMHVVRIDELDEYVDPLRADPAEVQALFQDLLIGVTQFSWCGCCHTAASTISSPERC